MELGNKVLSLVDELKQPTEKKIIGENRPQAIINEDDFASDFENDLINERLRKVHSFNDNPEEKEPPFLNDEDQDLKPEKKSNPEASAKVAVEFSNVALQTIFAPLAKGRMKRSLTSDEWEQVEDLSLKPSSELSSDELKLVKKSEKAVLKLEDQLKELPFDDDERERLVTTLTEYFEITGKEFDSTWLLAMSAITAVGKRVATVYLK
jgi:hypothetical protein